MLGISLAGLLRIAHWLDDSSIRGSMAAVLLIILAGVLGLAIAPGDLEDNEVVSWDAGDIECGSSRLLVLMVVGIPLSPRGSIRP